MAGVRYKPDLDEFVALSKQGNVVPVCRTLLGDTLTPVSAYEKFARGEYSFLLESAEGGEKLARYSFLGTNPFMVFRARGSEVEIESHGAARKFRSEDPLAELQKQVFAFRAVGVPGLPRFCGGAVGYAAYDAIRYIERLPNPPPDALGLPDLFFAFYDLMVVFDHLQKTVLVIC